jgi:hypothetical protein
VFGHLPWQPARISPHENCFHRAGILIPRRAGARSPGGLRPPGRPQFVPEIGSRRVWRDHLEFTPLVQNARDGFFKNPIAAKDEDDRRLFHSRTSWLLLALRRAPLKSKLGRNQVCKAPLQPPCQPERLVLLPLIAPRLLCTEYLAAGEASKRSNCKGPLGLPCAITPEGRDRQRPAYRRLERGNAQSRKNVGNDAVVP